MTIQNSILYIYPHADPLDPAGSGGQNRLYNLVTKISEHHDIVILGPENEMNNDSQDKYQTYRQKTPGFLSDIDYSLARKLQQVIRSEDPDIIHIPYPSGLVLSRFVSRISGHNAKIVLDSHDVMSKRAREFKNENLGVLTEVLRRVYVPTLESIATRVADHILTVSQKDAKLMEQLNGIPRDKITVIPNGADQISESELTDRKIVRDNLNLDSTTDAIVFHGNYETGTHNKQAAERIITKIAPRFKSENIMFFIIGKGAPTTELQNVNSMGFVEDLYSTLNAMDIAIVPLTSGTATKLKMFDYMSVSLPIISTAKGIEGIKLRHNRDVINCDADPDQFVAAIDRLLDDDNLCEQLGNNSQKLVEERYNWSTIGDQLHDCYINLISNNRDDG